MKYLGKINIGANHAGKGDGVRPRTKKLNEKLFFTIREVKAFDKKYNGKTHCYICEKRAYVTTHMVLPGKKLIVCRKCKDEVYI